MLTVYLKEHLSLPTALSASPSARSTQTTEKFSARGAHVGKAWGASTSFGGWPALGASVLGAGRGKGKGHTCSLAFPGPEV